MRLQIENCKLPIASVCVLFVAMSGVTAMVGHAQRDLVTPIAYQDLLNGLKDPTRWPVYSGDYTGQRHSPLTQITPDNARQLGAQWTFQTETMARGRGFEATPLALDGVLYVTGPNDFAWALDGKTGRPFWRYRRDLPNNLTYGASVPVNRGFAVLGNRLFMTTLDAHLVALDMRNGGVLWDVEIADYKIGHSATVSPLAVKDKIIV
ncbi:MAG TPA: PQQ-binding-like beta-propeller repeat protein, partial [Vicinamibacterales bacterium]|nr:PQQ-binding-like beta-propeller repeat protein [Vicinamibacterales bacterium]